MKLNNLVVIGLLLGLSACEKKLPEYETSICQLNFQYGLNVGLKTNEVTEEMRRISHSFILNSDEGVEVDTVWVKVTTMGYLSKKDRLFELEQVMENENDAVAGKHYVAFDDAEIRDFYRIPAGKADALVPIVVKRDPSLTVDGDVILKFTFKENSYFKLGYSEFSYCILTISDRLTKPTMWTTCGLDNYFGVYGPVKHELMIEWTGKNWDNTYIESLFYEFVYSNGTKRWVAKDYQYMNYLASWFAEKLAKANVDRVSDPTIGEVYKEADGTEVSF